MIDYTRLYILDNKLNYNPQLVHSGQLRAGFTKTWMGFGGREMSEPAEWSFFSQEILVAKVIPNEPLRFIYKRQAKLLQYTTCEVKFHFFNKEVVQLLNDNRATGISYYPTIIEHKKEKRTITEYSGIQISGRFGDIDRLRGEIIPYSLPNGNVSKRMKGMYFIDDNWGGLDFSVHEKGGFIVTTQRIRDLFEEHKISGAEFISLYDYLLLVT